MKNILSILIILLLSAGSLLAKCTHGEGGVVTKEITVEQFNTINIQSSADVEITQGDKQSVKVTGQANMIDLLSTKVSNGAWEIDFTESVCMRKEFVVKITVPNLDKIEINGSGNVTSIGSFKQDEMEVKINGSGDASLNIDCEEIKLYLTGSGDVKLLGNATSMKSYSQASGDLIAEEFEVKEALVRNSGSGNSFVKASDSADFACSGSGDIIYEGNPDKLDIRASGSGNVKQN